MQDLEVTTPAHEPPDRLVGLASWLLNQARSTGNRHVARRLGASGLRTDYAVLAALEEAGPISQASIGRRLGIDRGDLVVLLDRLGAQGRVQRQPDPADRRRNLVTITAAGRRRLLDMDVLIAQAQDDLLEPLGADERAVLIDLLQRLAGHQRR